MNVRARWRTILGYLIPGLGVAAAALATGLDFVPYHDEGYYIPLSHHFARGVTLELVRTYDGFASSAGPFMYATYGAWLRVVGEGAGPARLFSALLMATAGAAAVDVGRLAGARGPIWLGLAVLALPHFASCGITVLSEPMALLGGVVAVDFWLRGLRSGREGWFWLAAVPLAVAVNTRPTQLALALALAAIGVLTRGVRLASLAAPALALLAQAPHWWLWGGPYPPTQTSGMIPGVETRSGINVATLVHLVGLVGLVSWPAIPALARRAGGSRRFWAVAAVVAAAVYVAFRPDLSPRFSGPLAVLGRARGGAFGPLLVLPYLAGALLAAWAARLALDRARPAVDRTLASVALAGLGIYVLSPLAYERYALMATPFWVALLVPRIEESPRAWVAWRSWVVALLVASALAVAAIDRNRPVGQWEITAARPSR